jgi:hypothetical protein
MLRYTCVNLQIIIVDRDGNFVCTGLVILLHVSVTIRRLSSGGYIHKPQNCKELNLEKIVILFNWCLCESDTQNYKITYILKNHLSPYVADCMK